MRKSLRCIFLASQACLSVALVSGVKAQSLPQEVQVGKRTMTDYEFDWGRDGVYCPTCNVGAGNNRYAVIDANGNLWVGHVHPDTGALVPSDASEGKLVATNATPAKDTGNGPEWMSLTNTSAILYDKYIKGTKNLPNNHCVGFAHPTPDGSWDAGCMDNTVGNVLPIGTFTPGDS